MNTNYLKVTLCLCVSLAKGGIESYPIVKKMAQEYICQSKVNEVIQTNVKEGTLKTVLTKTEVSNGIQNLQSVYCLSIQ
jgi:hypothetical protein